MNFTTTLTSKNQITIPKAVRKKLGIKTGVKIDMYPTQDGFIGRIQKPSNIQRFFGDLKDDKRDLREIRNIAQQIEGRRLAKKSKVS